MYGYIGEIRMVAFPYPPVNWAICAGQILPIDRYEVVFALLGVTYGGDGRTTFALPDLRGRVPMGPGTFQVGQKGGQRHVALNVSQLPAHTHGAPLKGVRAAAIATNPVGNLPAVTQAEAYGPRGEVLMASGTVAAAGSSQPHLNVQPSLGVNFIICLDGAFPIWS